MPSRICKYLIQTLTPNGQWAIVDGTDTMAQAVETCKEHETAFPAKVHRVISQKLFKAERIEANRKAFAARVVNS